MTTLQAQSRNESSPRGAKLASANHGLPYGAEKLAPEAHAGAPGLIIWAEFDSKHQIIPFARTTSIDELAAELERDPTMGQHLAAARQTIGERIHANRPDTLAALRLSRGLSQAQLANLSHTSQSHIACIELGKNDPGTDIIERIANALGVTGSQVHSAVVATRTGGGIVE